MSVIKYSHVFLVEPVASVISCLQATGCVTAGSVTVRAAGLGSTATAAPALRRARRRMAQSAAAGADASAASASAPYLERLGTSVRSARHVGMPAALRGESTFMPSES